MDAIVLAGGLSRRMGTDKARLVIDGRTMLDRAVVAVRQAQAKRIIIVGWRPAPMTNGATDASSAQFGADVAVVPDRLPGSGPLGGLVDGMQALAAFRAGEPGAPGAPGARGVAGQPGSSNDRPSLNAVVLVVACDHPDLDPVELSALAALLEASPATVDAVVPTVGGRAQPLHAAYRLAVMQRLGRAFDEGERSVVRALIGVAVLPVDRGADAATGSYRDLDTQQQLTHYLADRPTIQ